MSGINQFLQKNMYRLLMLGYAIAYFLPLNNRRLWIPDEARYAEISREMIRRGDWVVPHLLGLDYFEKPIAGYWLNSLSQWLFGESHFAVRFASALCTGLTGLLIFWFAQQLFQSRKKAIAAAVIYLSFLLVYAIGTYSVLDAMVTLWLNLTLVVFYWSLQATSSRKKLIGYGVVGAAVGLGFLTKGFIALVVPCIVALPYLIYRHQLNELRYVWIALVTLLLVSLPWAIAVHLRAPDFWHYFFWVEHVQRFSAENAQHREAFWFYIPVIIMGSFPWLAVAPAALKKAWLQLELRPQVIFLLCWAIIPLVFFSIAKGKLPTYVLPCFAPLAILLGYGFTELIEQQQWRAIRINAWLNLAFGGLLALSIGLLGSGIVAKNPIYTSSEKCTLMLAVFIFISWAACGLLSLRYSKNALAFTALCPLALGLLLGWAIPKSAIYSKLPETFIAENQQKLNGSKFVFSDDPGLALSLAWELKRDDIQLYSSEGELAYGLKTSLQADKLLDKTNFEQWLITARKQGNVSVLTHHGLKEVPDDFPKADEVITQQRFTLFYYRQQFSEASFHEPQINEAPINEAPITETPISEPPNQ